MKFKIRVKHKDSDAEWWEEYDKAIDDPEAWAIKTIAEFNDSLRPGEQAREYVGFEIIDGGLTAHDWDKNITQMSQMFRGRMYDGMRCKNCGITGKRFGLESIVKIDAKYRAKKFQNCSTAIEAMRHAV